MKGTMNVTDLLDMQVSAHKTKGKTKAKAPALTRVQRQRRERRQATKALYDPTQPLGGKNLRNIAQRLANAEVNPTLRALSTQAKRTEAQANRVTGNAKSYYSDLVNKTAAALTNQQGIQDRYQASIGNAGQAAQSMLAGQGQAQQQRMAEDASVRGAIQGTENPASAVADTVAKRALESQARTGIDAQHGATTGAAAETALNSQALSTGQAGGERISDLTKAFTDQLGKIREARTEAQSQRGAKRNEYLTKLRDSEFEKAITIEGLGLDRAKLAASAQEAKAAARDAKADNKREAAKARRAAMESDRQYQLDLDKFGAEQAKENYQRENGLGAYKPSSSDSGSSGSKKRPLTRVQVNRYIEQAEDVKARLAQKVPIKNEDGKTTGYMSTEEKFQRLVSGQTKGSYPAIIVKAVYEAQTPAGLTKETAKRLRRLGLKPQQVVGAKPKAPAEKLGSILGSILG